MPSPPRLKPTAISSSSSNYLSSLSPSSGTRGPLVVGLNKYSHDAAVCIVDAATSEILFACEKERLTRKKHDAGGERLC